MCVVGGPNRNGLTVDDSIASIWNEIAAIVGDSVKRGCAPCDECEEETSGLRLILGHEDIIASLAAAA